MCEDLINSWYISNISLNAYYVPGTLLGARNRMENKIPANKPLQTERPQNQGKKCQAQGYKMEKTGKTCVGYLLNLEDLKYL